MMKISTAMAMIAAAATMTCAGTASAAVFTATFSGTVLNGRDYTGVFGAAGRDLSGLAISTVLTYDTSLGATATGPNSVSLTGGSSFGVSPFLVSTRTTIDGALRRGRNASAAPRL